MKRNMGSSDRIIRALIAAVIAILFINQIITGILGIILLILAGIFVLTGFFSFCPIYRVVGIHTNKTEKQEEPDSKKKMPYIKVPKR